MNMLFEILSRCPLYFNQGPAILMRQEKKALNQREKIRIKELKKKCTFTADNLQKERKLSAGISNYKLQLQFIVHTENFSPDVVSRTLSFYL